MNKIDLLKCDLAGLSSHIGMLKHAYQDLPIDSCERRQLISERVSAQLKSMAIQNEIIVLMKESVLLQYQAERHEFKAVS